MQAEGRERQIHSGLMSPIHRRLSCSYTKSSLRKAFDLAGVDKPVLCLFAKKREGFPSVGLVLALIVDTPVRKQRKTARSGTECICLSMEVDHTTREK